MRNRQTALERALPIVAAAYGEQFGVRVVLSGTDACTDGQTIVLPMLENMSAMKDVLFGYLAHESAHIRDSDFSTLARCRSPIERSMTNLIEDIRIEGLIQDAFPGTRFTLTAMEEYIHAQGWTPVPGSEENEASQLFRYLYHRFYGEYLSREVYQPLISASQQVVEKTFPVGFFVRLDGLLGKYMDNLKCSDDCLIVARAILKALKEAEDEEQESKSDPEQPQNADSQDDANGDDSGQGQGDCQSSDSGEGSGQSDQSDDSDGSQSSDASNEDSSGKSGQTDNSDGSQPTNADQHGQPQNTDAGNSQGSGPSTHDRVLQETDLPEDVTNQLRGDLAAQAQEDQSGHPFQINTTVGQEVGAVSGDTSELQTGILTSSTIRSRLIGMLQTQSRTSQRLHSKGRKVDGRRLSRLASGDTRVFIQRNETKRPETSVHVLLDCSGSMNFQQDIANQATVSLALAISTIPQCDIAVSMFPGINGSVSPMIKRGQVVRANIGKFAVRSGGTTPLAEGLLYAARELSGSHKQRQVIIVITDGDPDNGTAVNYINGLIKDQITTYAIGIGSEAVETYFKNWCVINDVRELQSALFNIASNMLELDL